MRINGSTLKMLRAKKRLSQEQLAELTKKDGRPKIDTQTISRLERGKGNAARRRTVEQLACALGIDAEVLTGDAPIENLSEIANPLTTRNQLNVRVDTAARNALLLAAKRYGIEASQIIELAPFLFVWVAEESLRRRRERIDEIEQGYDSVLKIEAAIPYLPKVNSTYPDDKIAAENSSIDRKDLFGEFTREIANYPDPYFDFDMETQNPFALFLRKLGADFGEASRFDSWDGSSSPRYRICPQEAADLVGGDEYCANAILNGLVALNELPKELRNAGRTKERADWVRLKAAEAEEKIKDWLAELGIPDETPT